MRDRCRDLSEQAVASTNRRGCRGLGVGASQGLRQALKSLESYQARDRERPLHVLRPFPHELDPGKRDRALNNLLTCLSFDRHWKVF